MRIVFAGTPEVALPTLNALAESRHEIVAVVTRPDAPSGRGRKLTPSPVAVRAEELGIEVLKPEHPRDEAFQARLRDLDPDCCPVVAYGALLPQSALDIPRLGWINLHFSLLPEYRGAAPVQRAVWNGEEFSGATTFRIVKELDAGPTFGVMTQLLAADETAGSLFDKLSDGGAGLMVATLDALEDGAIEARPQPLDGITYAPKITVDDARIDWTRAAVALDHQIRACTPAPGAWTLLDGERFKVGPSTVVDGDLKPGEIAVLKNDVLVGTGSQCLRLGLVKAFGKKEMPAGDWARGVRLGSDARFGD